MFNQKKSKLMQTKGQLVKNLNTAFSFAPPSILSLTIFLILQTGIEQNRCAMACKGCGAVFYFFLKKAVTGLS